MVVIKSVLEMIGTRDLNTGDAVRLLYDYKNMRTTCRKRDWDDECKVIGNKLEDVITEILIYLRNLDSMTYYPISVRGGLRCKDRDEVLLELIKLID